MGSGGGFGVKSRASGGSFSHALSAELEAVRVVNEAVQDGVGESGIADRVMPALHRELAGDDGCFPAVAVLEDFEEVAPLGGGERREAPVVEE